MVVYSVAEPCTFQINRHVLEILTVAVAFVIGIDSFEHFPDTQVITSVLVPQYIAAVQSRFLQIIYKRFLLEREFVESLNLVPKHLQVGKLLVGIFESVAALCRRCGHTCSKYHCTKQMFHFVFYIRYTVTPDCSPRL